MEHLHHFRLKQDPFSNEPDLRVFFESASHRDAQLRAERGLRQRKGLTVMTGEGGMGKTLLARRILDSLEEEVFEATMLVMMPGAADATGILQRFARQLGVDEPAMDRAGLVGQIYEQLSIVREDGRHAVLIIDDAQIMSSEVLSELGGLLNLEYEDRRLVSLLLIGSPELDALVENDPGIAPRVEVRVRIRPLDDESATAYVLHRLTQVGGSAELLPSETLDALHKFGQGRPRLLNTLADNALFEAYLAGRSKLDAMDIARAAADLGMGESVEAGAFGPELVAPTSIEKAPELDLSFDSAPLENAVGTDARVDPEEDTQSGDVLELSNPLFEPLAEPATDEPAEATFESLNFETEPVDEDPLEMALVEAEFCSEDSEELAGVFVELIEE